MCESVTTHPSHLSELRQHHHDGGVVLPKHPPEVLCGFRQRTLCGDIRLLLPAGTTHEDAV